MTEIRGVKVLETSLNALPHRGKVSAYDHLLAGLKVVDIRNFTNKGWMLRTQTLESTNQILQISPEEGWAVLYDKTSDK